MTASNDMQRQCVLQIPFIPLFPKLTMVNLAFMPGFSSVVGSAPSADGSREACDCLGRNGRRHLSILSTHLPFNLRIPLHLPFHLFFILFLPSNSSPEDARFSGCHQLLLLSIVSPHLLPLSLFPDFPDPCCTKLSLRVS